MQCAIYSLPEMKLRLRLEKKGAVVLARYRGMLILRRDPEKDVWTLPYATKERGETPEMTARRALAKALGDAEFDVFPLCGYSVTQEDGKERGGVCFTADVYEWPGEIGSGAKAFARLPISSQIENAALTLGLFKWAGDFFDERLDVARLGDVGRL